MKKTLTILAAAIMSSGAAIAAERTITLTPEGTASFANPGAYAFEQGDDVMTFMPSWGMCDTACTYDVQITGNGLISFAHEGGLNGEGWRFTGNTTGVTIYARGSTSNPLTFKLMGFGAEGSSYTGMMVAGPIPEPSTYALMAGGIMALTVIAKRRERKQAQA